MQHNVKIVGIAGKAGYGKTTVSKMIYELCPRTEVAAFAAPLKGLLSVIFQDLTDYHLKDPVGKVTKTDLLNGHSPRELMQFFGTDFVREFDPNLWVKLAKKKIEVARQVPPRGRLKLNVLVFDDVRFENELELIRKYSGCIIHLERKPKEQSLLQKFGDVVMRRQSIWNHESEKGVRHLFDEHYDYVLDTDEDIMHTKYKVHQMAEQNFSPDYQP